MRGIIITLSGMLVTGLSIWFGVPAMGFEVEMWVLMLSASVGGLFTGLFVLLGESVIENIALVIILLVLAAVVSGMKPGLGFIFLCALFSGVIGTITNQVNQYLSNRELNSGASRDETP